MYTKYKIVPFCPYHFVHTILSNTILSVYHFVHTILSVPFCPLPFCPVTVVRILKSHGLPTSSLHEVTRATVLARLLYAANAWRGFATAQDCSRIDRFINKTVNLGYLPAD